MSDRILTDSENLKKGEEAVGPIKVTREEQENMILIHTKVGCAEQALRQLPTLKEYTREELVLFIQGAITTLAEARFLERVWWVDIYATYNLKGDWFFDGDAGILTSQSR